jgi:hypothetical protein
MFKKIPLRYEGFSDDQSSQYRVSIRRFGQSIKSHMLWECLHIHGQRYLYVYTFHYN